MAHCPLQVRHSLALITIGQSPRHDYTADLPFLLPSDTILTQHGALDSLTLSEVYASLSPSPDTKQVLVSRMRDGTEVKMDAEKLEPLISDCVQRVASQVVPDAILLLCTGMLPSFNVTVPVVGPQEAVRRYLEVERTGMNLVIISPEERQVTPAQDRWDGVGGSVVLGGTMATPYGEDSPAEVEAAAKWVTNLPDLKRTEDEPVLGSVLVYMDCMGYTLEHKRMMERSTKGKITEVIVPREVVFRAVSRRFGKDA